MQLTEIEEKSRLEGLVEKLKDELKLVKESKTNDLEHLKVLIVINFMFLRMHVTNQ